MSLLRERATPPTAAAAPLAHGDGIAAEGVWHTPDGATRPALAGVSLTLKPGEHVALLGHNGSGKSTLARHLNGQLVPQRGTVTVDGLPTADPAALPAIRRVVGRIFQNPDHQIVGASVEEDVLWGMPRGLDPVEARRRTAEALAAVGLGGCEERPTWRLSGGQKQRLALAGVLARGSRYLVCDEPTAMLDGRSREDVAEVLLACRARGLGLLWITHRLDETLNADRIVLLRAGRVAADGPPAQVLAAAPDLAALLPATAVLASRLARDGVAINPLPASPEALAGDLLAALDGARRERRP